MKLWAGGRGGWMAGWVEGWRGTVSGLCLWQGALPFTPMLHSTASTYHSSSLPQFSVPCAALPASQAAKPLSWPRLLSMAGDAAKGMLYLHSRSPPVFHRDLKSANLLVDVNWHVKVRSRAAPGLRL